MRTLTLFSELTVETKAAKCCVGRTGLLFPVVWLLLGPSSRRNCWLRNRSCLLVSCPDGVVFFIGNPPNFRAKG